MQFRRHQEQARRGTLRLLALFALVVGVTVLATNAALAAALWLTLPFFAREGWLPPGFVETNTMLVLLYVLGGWWLESQRLREGGPHVAARAGARLADRDDPAERRFANVVAEMALAAQRPAPQAWVLPDDAAINAFAAGWSADDAVVAVTRGALERLDRAELQGVVGHEIAHLEHGDTVLNMRLIGMVWGLRLLFDLGRTAMQPGEDGRRPATVLLGAALVVAGSAGWLAGRLLQAAVSRQREFLADATAVQYTRQVDGLGGALRKIAAQQQRAPAPLGPRVAALAPLLLAADVHGRAGWRQRLDAWLASHPPLAERIRRVMGRPLPGLDFAPLPAPVDEPAEPMLAPAFAATAPGARRQPAAAAAAPPHAAQFDPLQREGHAAPEATAAAREAEALARIAHWHSGGELQLALRALLGLDDGSASASHLAPSSAAALRAEVAALRPPAAAQVLDVLASRAAQRPRPERDALRAALRPLWASADGARDTRTLAALLLHQRLRGRRLRFNPPGPRNTLNAQAAAVAQAGAALADLLDADAGFVDRLLAALGLAAAARGPYPTSPTSPTSPWPARAAPAAGPVSMRRALRALLRLQRLAAMQRPLPLRAAVALTRGTPPGEDAPATTAVLFLVARLLDAPLPPAVVERLAVLPPDLSGTPAASDQPAASSRPTR